MTTRRRWTKDELYIALRIYCELPFGQLHQHQPRIIEVAEKLKRSPSSLAMKLCNMASLDPDITGSGRRGLPGASALDKAVWQEVSSDWEAFLDHSEPLLEEQQITPPPPDIPDKDTGEYTITTKGRRNQAFFRQAVLTAYDNQCCITGLNQPTFLVASHIIPWRDKKHRHRRLDPKNGLCLSSLHDRAFDQGLLTLNERYEISLSSQLLKLDGDFARDSFDAYQGKSILKSNKFAPCLEALAYHRTEIFRP